MEVKINADMNNAIEQIANKIGIAAKDIIPRYTRLAKVQGYIHSISGVIIGAFPWVLLPQPTDGEQAEIMWAMRVAFTFLGFVITVMNLENIFAPDAIAIDKLISSLSKTKE